MDKVEIMLYNFIDTLDEITNFGIMNNNPDLTQAARAAILEIGDDGFPDKDNLSNISDELIIANNRRGQKLSKEVEKIIGWFITTRFNYDILFLVS